jgi:hypothetical protein
VKRGVPSLDVGVAVGLLFAPCRVKEARHAVGIAYLGGERPSGRLDGSAESERLSDAVLAAAQVDEQVLDCELVAVLTQDEGPATPPPHALDEALRFK